MTSTLPPDVRNAFESFITCELTTVDAAKQPITWPVTPYYSQGGPTIDVTTGLGYPKKADDAQAHPSVSLLFSDPTGSGIDSGLRVLVQGTATVDDEDLKANAERYVRESGVKLPATKKMNPPKPLRPMFNWYYARALHQGPPGTGLRLAGGGPRRRADPPRRPSRRGPLGTRRRAPRGPRGGPEGTAGLGPADGIPG